MKLQILLLTFILSLFLIPSKAFAATYYVSTTGNDANNGSQSTPWKTIQKAATSMSAGDTVNVQAGNYPERVSIAISGNSGSQITYKASGVVAMKGFTVTASYLTIDGFEISNQVDNGTTGRGVYVTGSNNIIQNNYIHDCSWGGILLGTGSNNTAKNNRMTHNGQNGIEVYGTNNLIEGNDVSDSIQWFPGVATPTWADADGMRFFGTGHVFRKNYIHDITFDPIYNKNPHIDCFQTWTDGGHTAGSNITFEQNICKNRQYHAQNETGNGFMIEGAGSNITFRNNIIEAFCIGQAFDHSGMILINNTFISDLAYTQLGSAGLVLSNAPNSVVKNNIFYDTAAYPSANASRDVAYNLVYWSNGGTPAGSPGSPGSPNANDLWKINPQFVNAGSGNYHLQSTSPAINAGLNLSSLGVTNDLDGVNRPQGSGYDIGSYEYTSIQPTPSPSVLPSPSLIPSPSAVPSPSSSCPSGLSAYWPLDALSGGQTPDKLGINNGTINGTTLVTGKLNNAFSFDGNLNYIDVPDSPSLNLTGNSISLEAWVNYDPISSTKGIISKSGYSNGYRILIKTDNSVLLQLGTVGELGTGANILTPSIWHHVVGTYDGTGMKIYIDGQLKISNSASGNLVSTTAHLWIGQGDYDCIGQTWCFPYKGLIDEVAVYGRALTQAEISDHFNGGSGKNYCAAGQTSSPSPSCRADLNGDNSVNLADIVAVLGKWGQTGTLAEDINGDGIVNLGDLQNVLSLWGQTCN